MECPRCRKDTLSSEGICLSCNYSAEENTPPAEPETADNAIKDDENKTEMASAADVPSDPQEDTIPPWRQELSQKLAALKQKKDAEDRSSQIQSGAARPVARPTAMNATIHANAASSRNDVNVPARNPSYRKIQLSAASTRLIEPQQRTIASLGPEVYSQGATLQSSAPKDIQKPIDSAIARQSSQIKGAPSIFKPEPPEEPDNKFILLSRTLSGLIDLIIIILCTGAFIISADYASGIEILDAFSLVEYSGLFLLIYFLYSIFFLAASNQTVGMMITDLRISGIEGKRPSMGQLLNRCLAYLLSVVVLGVGLLWSFFDERNRCFHDRVSKTYITRI